MGNYIITGASRGIGFETTKELCSKGHNVWALSRKTDALTDLKSSNENWKLNIVQYDLSQPSEIEFPFDQLDGLINNAGLLINKPFLELSQKDFQDVYQVNVFGVVSLIQRLVPYLTTSKGTVLNISSVGGVNGSSKFPGLSAYSSSKGALITLTECLAEELNDKDISVNCLALGAVQTEMLEEAFPGYQANTSPKEMGAYIADFVVNRSKLFNGKTISVANSTP